METKDKKILIYAGINRGHGFWPKIQDFDIVIGFEPIPEICNDLISKSGGYEHVTILNVALSEKKEKKTFYITPNIVSSSLHNVNETMGDQANRLIEVQCDNLYDILQLNGIDHIDYLVSDTQGSDLTILKTIKPLLDKKMVYEMFLETHNEVEIYEGLNNNFSGFKELLSDNYEIEYISADGTIIEPDGDLTQYLEFDVKWVVK